ncbi:hypothetical protein [Stutzerimonas nitrititolerans]|uniref:hypothetical protein n=1 Tax=Stutzerimonas nitrititolerans TaxID=2482751 RepID=UPI0028A0F791|nr:hypothetical protein [Stutzerimonas nitrititolerans]
MKVGYAMLYPYRGSIQNMIFISKMFEREGHSSFFLKCNASVPHCYNRLIKNRSRIVECSKCLLGSVDTFDVSNVTNIRSSLRTDLSSQQAYEIIASSSFSLNRIETDEDCVSEEVTEVQKKLVPLAEITYANALKWIDDNGLDLVFIFNGRLDMPRAVLKACEFKGVPYITFEAAYPGIALEINDDCRSLKSLHKIIGDYINYPLSMFQSNYAAQVAAKMLKKKNFVWRLYNTAPEATTWPRKSDKKILIVPSSNHEFKGVAAWTPEWKHPLDGIEAVLSKLGASPSDCVIRCHPNWSENIGAIRDGSKSERVYVEWANRNGAFIIPSSSKCNTNDLIVEADYVIVQYGTAGIEGGLLGKKVIGLSPSWYSSSGFTAQVHGVHDLDNLNFFNGFDSVDVVRRSLRFLYAFHKRYPQYTNFVRSVSIYENAYFDGADVSRVLRAVENNVFDADDCEIASEPIHEDAVVAAFVNGEYERFLNWKEEAGEASEIPINRKRGYRWIDDMRTFFKAGDK